MAYAVKNGTLYTCDANNTVVDHGTLLIKEGKIEAILDKGKPIPDGYDVIDAEGKATAIRNLLAAKPGAKTEGLNSDKDDTPDANDVAWEKIDALDHNKNVE